MNHEMSYFYCCKEEKVCKQDVRIGWRDFKCFRDWLNLIYNQRANVSTGQGNVIGCNRLSRQSLHSVTAQYISRSTLK